MRRNWTVSREFTVREAETGDLRAVVELKNKLDRYHRYPKIRPPEGGKGGPFYDAS
jgi:hypothetical protein